VFVLNQRMTSLSMYNPSTWWNIQCERDETASLRKTLPGEIVLIGGLFSSIPYLNRWRVRTQQNIWISLYKKCLAYHAGWYSGKFNAVKLCQSSSISGPSDIETDIRKISIIWFYQWNSDGIRWLPVQKNASNHRKAFSFSLFSKVSWMLYFFLPQRILTN
jgi:hypothetical protein